jgi:hypothetical protein
MKYIFAKDATIDLDNSATAQYPAGAVVEAHEILPGSLESALRVGILKPCPPLVRFALWLGVRRRGRPYRERKTP